MLLLFCEIKNFLTIRSKKKKINKEKNRNFLTIFSYVQIKKRKKNISHYALIKENNK